ncbi:MAG TPA: pitrilysin family protein [Thermoanaerobaculia bacterium]|nr:pitrilysin family protein [Thermoanaerobaculia bacterium]
MRKKLHTLAALAPLATLAALSVATPVFAQKQAPPEAGPAKDFQVPTPRKFSLDNGLGVTFVTYGSVPKATVRLAVRSGHIDEAANQVWLSDLVGDYLTQGTATKSATEIAEAAARMGGSIDVAVGADRTDIGGDVLSEFAPDMVRLVADVVRNPKFPESELARLKGDRARQLAIARTQPRPVAQEKFLAVLYPDHPYGRLFPTPDMLQGYTLAQVRAFHEANYGAARAHIYVVGHFDEKAMEAAIRAAFGDWKKGAAPTVNPPKPTGERAVYLIDRPGAVQSTVILGMPVIDPSNPDWIPLQVTNTLLGGFFSSRITANIREAKGYTYSPASAVTPRNHDAYWAEIADVTTAVTGPSLKEIFYEMDRLQGEAPPEKELAGIKNYMAGTFVLQNSSRPGIIGQLAFVDLQGLPDDYLNRFVANVNAVTPAKVQETAKKDLPDDKATIVIAGDRKVIEEQVKPYGTIK